MYGNYAHPDQIKDMFKSVDDEDVENLRFFITDGADPDTRGDDGRTLLLHAMINKKYHAAETLLEMGADPDLTIERTGHSALHYAAADDHTHMIGVLAAYKADLNLPDNFGWTPLHMATGRGKVAAVKALVEHGADLSRRDQQDDRPLELARLRAGHALEMLNKPGALIAAYLHAQMENKGVEFITPQERADSHARDIAALKQHNPGRFKLKM